MTPRVRNLLAGGAVAVAIVAAVGGSALAQTPTPPASGSPAIGTPRPTAQQRVDAFINALAAKLGKSPDELKNAIKAVEKDRVAQALQAGRITQDQANTLNQRIDQGQGLGLRGPGLGEIGPRGAGKPGAGKPGAGLRGELSGVAAFLGLQPQELKTQLGAGKSLAQIAQAKGKSRDDLKSFLTNEAKTRLSAAVTAGRLTQAQADQMLAKMTANLDQMIDRVAQPGQRGTGGRGNPGPAAQRGASL